MHMAGTATWIIMIWLTDSELITPQNTEDSKSGTHISESFLLYPQNDNTTTGKTGVVPAFSTPPNTVNWTICR